MFIDNNNNNKNKTLFIKLVNNSCKEFTVYGILSSSFFALALPFVKKKREFNYKSLLISYLFSLKCYLFVFFFSSLSFSSLLDCCSCQLLPFFFFLCQI